MKSKVYVEVRTRIQNALWMVLVLLCIGFIWRGLGAWLAIIESGYFPHNQMVSTDLMQTFPTYFLENLQSELFPFVGQVLGLACLLHICPLQRGAIEQSIPSDTRSSAFLRDHMTGGDNVIS